MSYFLYILIALLVVLGTWLLEGGVVGALIQAPALILTLIPPLLFSIAATSGGAFGLSWKLVSRRRAQADPKEVEQACAYLKVFGYTSLFLGAIGSVMGIIATLASAKQNIFEPEPVHHMGAALIAIFWGMIFKVLCHVAEQRIRSRYSSYTVGTA